MGKLIKESIKGTAVKAALYMPVGIHADPGLYNQPFNENHLRSCPLLDNPRLLTGYGERQT